MRTHGQAAKNSAWLLKLNIIFLFDLVAWQPQLCVDIFEDGRRGRSYFQLPPFSQRVAPVASSTCSILQILLNMAKILTSTDMADITFQKESCRDSSMLAELATESTVQTCTCDMILCDVLYL